MSRHLSYLSPERNLEHETLIDMPKRVPVSQWLEKQFGHPWHPLDNPEGRWTMAWAGRNSNFTDLANFDKYQVYFADQQDLSVFKLTFP
jgi:hypothetical protein